MPTIRQYQDASDRAQVIELWRQVFGYEDAHNEPSLSISRKLAAVHSQQRGCGLGGRLVRAAEDALATRGCVKINVQLLASNEATTAFYQSLGYKLEPRVSMGKLLTSNIPHSKPSH